MTPKKKSIQFDGNRYTDIFYGIIYASTLFLSKLNLLCFFLFKKYSFINKKKHNKFKNESIKILYITRKWGTNTSMNIELYKTLSEYLDGSNSKLIQLEVDNNIEIAHFFLEYFNNNEITHVVYDVRIFINKNGYRGILNGLKNCYEFSFHCNKFQIIQLCGLTDLVQPGQRIFAEILTRINGLIVSWGSVGFHEIRKFNHNRICGPLFLPISKFTVDNFNKNSIKNTLFDVGTVGTGYEPRLSLLNSLSKRLDLLSIKHYFNNEKNLSYLEYLNVYNQSKISINTSWIGSTFPGKMHFTHRNFEILFTGSLLFTQNCFGLSIYLQEGVDYVSYTDLEDLLEKIIYYLNNEKEADIIRKSGQKKIQNYFHSNFVWNQINYTLKYNNIKPLKY